MTQALSLRDLAFVGGLSGGRPEFIFRVTTSSPATTFTLRTTGTVDYAVDWGDGSKEIAVTTNTKTHEYATANTYTIVVTPAAGSTWRLYANNVAPDDLLITDLAGAGTGFPWGNILNGSFSGLENVASFPELNLPSTISDCVYAFYRLGITTFPLLSLNNCTRFWWAWASCFDLVNFPAGFFDNWTATPAANCFAKAWFECTSLSATSVENILNSIDTSGVNAPASGKEITIDYSTASGQPNINTAIVNLTAKGWEVRINGTLYTTWYNATDTDAIANINAVETKDGQGLETGVKQAINTLYTSLKTNNIYSKITQLIPKMGARTLQGGLVPIKGPSPVQYNFVSADYSRTAGLKGNGSTKWLDTRVLNNTNAQNSAHRIEYITELSTTGTDVIIASAPYGVFGSDYADVRDADDDPPLKMLYRSRIADAAVGDPLTPAMFVDTITTVVNNFFGISRGLANTRYFYSGLSATPASAMTAQAPGAHYLESYARASGTAARSSRRGLMTSIGADLTEAEVATYKTIVSTYISSVTAAI